MLWWSDALVSPLGLPGTHPHSLAVSLRLFKFSKAASQGREMY